jgi:hypothetical protein
VCPSAASRARLFRVFLATVNEPSVLATMSPADGFSLWSYSKATNSLDDRTFTKDDLVEQLSMTWDKSDYLWYSTDPPLLNLLLFNYLPLHFLVSLCSACSSLKAWCSVNIYSTEQFLKSGKWPQLTVYSNGPRPAGVRQRAVIRAAAAASCEL